MRGEKFPPPPPPYTRMCASKREEEGKMHMQWKLFPSCKRWGDEEGRNWRKGGRRKRGSWVEGGSGGRRGREGRHYEREGEEISPSHKKMRGKEELTCDRKSLLCEKEKE